MNWTERTQISLIDADLNYLIELLKSQNGHRASTLRQKLEHAQITKEARVAGKLEESRK
jgi:hypothetical protein